MTGRGSVRTGGLAMILVWSRALLLPLGTAFGIVMLLEAAAHHHEWMPRARPLEPPRMEAEDELRYARGEIEATTLVQQRAVLGQP
jgi:hypothetical protein